MHFAVEALVGVILAAKVPNIPLVMPQTFYLFIIATT